MARLSRSELATKALVVSLAGVWAFGAACAEGVSESDEATTGAGDASVSVASSETASSSSGTGGTSVSSSSGSGGEGGGCNDPAPAFDAGCQTADNGVGADSVLRSPTGSVSRCAPFTKLWSYSSTSFPGCGGGLQDWSTKHGPFFADFSGDGSLDIAADVRLAGLVTFKATAGSFGSPNVYECGSGGQVDFGDMDGDGDLDMLQGNHSNDIRVYANNGAGSFTTSWELEHTMGLHGAAFGDFNGDGDLDIVTGADQFSYGVWIFFGNGAGTFTQANATGLGKAIGVGNIVVRDFNGDGHLDFFGNGDVHFGQVCFPSDPGCDPEIGTPAGPALYLNGGNGSTWTIAHTIADAIPNIGNSPRRVVVGDVDCDQMLDVAYAGAVHRGSQNNTFSSATTIGSVSSHMSFGDMDGDGHLDVLLAADTGSLSIYYGDGAGGFELGPDVGLPADSGSWVDVGDVERARRPQRLRAPRGGLGPVALRPVCPRSRLRSVRALGLSE
jgi:hypothetical protein